MDEMKSMEEGEESSSSRTGSLTNQDKVSMREKKERGETPLGKSPQEKEGKCNDIRVSGRTSRHHQLWKAWSMEGMGYGKHQLWKASTMKDINYGKTTFQISLLY